MRGSERRERVRIASWVLEGREDQETGRGLSGGGKGRGRMGSRVESREWMVVRRGVAV